MPVRLRNVVESDLETLFEQQNEPEGQRMAVFEPRNRKAFMAHWKKIIRNMNVLALAIECDGALAGHIGTWEQSGLRLVGYWIGRDFWNRGIATAAVTALLDLDRRRPLYARVAKTNVGSIRVLEKCGFSIAGEHRDGEVEELEMRLL